MNMTTGHLTRLVAFDAPTSAPDGYGGTEVGWTGEGAQVKAWAHFKYLRGTESVMAARLEGKQPIVITIPNFSAARAITTDWRMRDLHDGTFDSGGTWDGPTFNITQAPLPTQDRQWLELLVQGGVAV